jgi:DNA-binding transcriptional regulator YiaG
MLGFGTGEILTQQICKLREAGDRFQYRAQSNGDEIKTADIAASPAEDITHIRAVLKTSAADLAECIGVTRQALYNWKAGGNIKSTHLSKVVALKAAADVLLIEDVPGSPLVLDRKLPGGKTLLEEIAHGADGRETAMALVNMLREEATQRATLEKRLAGRLASARSSRDYGSPAYDERG